jgi:hypothetical protein
VPLGLLLTVAVSSCALLSMCVSVSVSVCPIVCLSAFLSYLKSAPTSLSASPNHLSIRVPALMLMKVAPHSEAVNEGCERGG